MAARKPTTQFTPPPEKVQGAQHPQPPYIHPSVSGSPEAMAYKIGAEARLQRRQQPSLQKYTDERPGDPPAMPPLEAEPVGEGLTMEQQAGMYGSSPEERASQAVGSSIIEGPRRVRLGSMQEGHPGRPRTPLQMGIQMTDTLHPDAQKDPEFIQGNGSMMAVNQPRMAVKYGVIRGGQHIPPQALQANVGNEQQRPGRTLRDTIRDMQAATGAVQPPPGIPRTEEEAAQQAEEGAANASQNVGKSPEPDDEEKKRVAKILDQMDDFDFEALRQQMNQDNLNNPEQRAIIEERLEPLSLEDLILKDRVRQVIPIIPNKLEVTFESLTGEEDLALKRLLMQESKSVEVVERYLLEKFGLMTIAAGLVAIKGNPVPYSIRDKNGDFDEKQFWLKFGWVLKRNIHVLACIGNNHTWFEMRVRSLMVAERVKNG